MTVTELINELQSLEPNVKVVVRGYESGYNDILKLEKIKIKEAKHSTEFDGQYDDSLDVDAIEAVNLFGENVNAEDVDFGKSWVNDH